MPNDQPFQSRPDTRELHHSARRLAAAGLGFVLLAACGGGGGAGSVMPPAIDRTWEVQSDTLWRAVFNVGTPASEVVDGEGDTTVDAVDEGDVCTTVLKLTDAGTVTLTLLPDGFTGTATESWRAITICIPGSF